MSSRGGHPIEGRPSPVVAEAIVGSIWSIAHRHFAEGRLKVLPDCWPRAAFVAMAPVIGAEEALAAVRSVSDSEVPSRHLETSGFPPTKFLSIS